MSATLPLEVQCTHRAPLRAESRRRLAVVLGISAVVMVAEAVGGWVAHSLALLADAGHMLADVGALGLSLGVASLAQRPVTAERTFGRPRLGRGARRGCDHPHDRLDRRRLVDFDLHLPADPRQRVAPRKGERRRAARGRAGPYRAL